MTDLEPVEPSAVLPRGGGPVTLWAGAGLPARRAIAATARRVLASGPLLPASMLAVAAVAAARAAERIARTALWPAGGEAIDCLVPSTRIAVLRVSWTYVEVRTRSWEPGSGSR